MTIRTPDEDIERPGYFYPPFTPGWHYVGATYPGHSDFSVDWNRRTKTGGWLDDTGDPVLAAADGKVTEVDPREGLVMLDHAGGYRTEYRHMTGPFPKVGDRVQRGDRIGSIGNVAGDGRSFGAHLHHVHYRNGKRIQQRFEGRPIPVSVGDSDTRPSTWQPPTPVMVQGPPPRATWESAYKEAEKALTKAQAKMDGLTLQVGALTEERDQARRELAACQAATPVDCSAEIDRALAAERKLDDIRAVLSR